MVSIRFLTKDMGKNLKEKEQKKRDSSCQGWRGSAGNRIMAGIIGRPPRLLGCIALTFFHYQS